MGNEAKQSRAMEPPLDLHSEVQHPTHGTIRVYSSRALPMTFLMRLERVTARSRLFNLYQQVQDQQSPALLTLYGFRIQRKEGCSSCENGDRTLEYWQYLNYSLESHIADRQRRGVSFTYQQLWHVLQVALTAAALLADRGLIWEVHPAQLVVTPEGKLKADWSHLQTDNAHLRYFQALEDGRTDLCWFSPEEVWLLRERERSNRLNLEKCNVYKLGLLLLALASLNTQPVLSERTWKQMQRFPQPLPSIAARCLSNDPLKRPTIQRIYEEGEEHFSSSYELLISEGRREQVHDERESLRAWERPRATRMSHEPKEASRHSRSLASNYQHRQTKGQLNYQTYDQRLAALREYRRNLALSRGGQR